MHNGLSFGIESGIVTYTSGISDSGNVSLTMELRIGNFGQVWVAWMTKSHKAHWMVCFGGQEGVGFAKVALSFDASLRALPFLLKAVIIGGGSC